VHAPVACTAKRNQVLLRVFTAKFFVVDLKSTSVRRPSSAIEFMVLRDRKFAFGPTRMREAVAEFGV
jgi:hypothetical protein